MAGAPKRREKRGDVVKPWKENPALSSRPPFERGNLMAVRHGAHSQRIVGELAGELVAGLLEDRPDLERFPEAVAAWSRAESQCLLLARWIDAKGVVDEQGAPLPALKYFAQFERLANDLRQRLGLDPRSEAELAQSQADAARSVVDIDALRARGRAALARRRELDGGERLRDGDGRLGEGEATT